MAAPWPVKAVICAASYIDETPLHWGGGHGSFESPGYDCSGAVSYALHGGRFLESPLDSTRSLRLGSTGPRTLDHGLRQRRPHLCGDRRAALGHRGNISGTGPRWHEDMASSAGFIVRHPQGY